jgi:hypothetical protein
MLLNSLAKSGRAEKRTRRRRVVDELCNTVSNLHYHLPPDAGLTGRQASRSRSFFLFCVLTSVVMQMGTHCFFLHFSKQNKNRAILPVCKVKNYLSQPSVRYPDDAAIVRGLNHCVDQI